MYEMVDGKKFDVIFNEELIKEVEYLRIYGHIMLWIEICRVLYSVGITALPSTLPVVSKCLRVKAQNILINTHSCFFHNLTFDLILM